MVGGAWDTKCQEISAMIRIVIHRTKMWRKTKTYEQHWNKYATNATLSKVQVWKWYAWQSIVDQFRILTLGVCFVPSLFTLPISSSICAYIFFRLQIVQIIYLELNSNASNYSSFRTMNRQKNANELAIYISIQTTQTGFDSEFGWSPKMVGTIWNCPLE